MTILNDSDVGVNCGDVEDDGCLFKGERMLCCGLVCECIEPGSKSDVNLKHKTVWLSAYHVKDILIWVSSTGNLRSRNSSCP